MDLNADINEADPNRKQFTLCSECHQVAMEKRINRLGVLCCLGAWWMCGLGVFFCLMMRSNFCNNCYKEKFLMKAHERRRLQLYMDDHSLCEPPVGTTEAVPRKRLVIQPK
ncbi:unnamed protein product [Cylicocyclus nassatus]|uniref:LITAF domain-containing protein n=1 Tax=Cylicocyclus nassatus TaxID=53992 RepID=A0AA36HA47_CYLNA|nr:unnamed protein product [Cylicocyclus nassatus]